MYQSVLTERGAAEQETRLVSTVVTKHFTVDTPTPYPLTSPPNKRRNADSRTGAYSRTANTS